jgi:hypothetical protein
LSLSFSTLLDTTTDDFRAKKVGTFNPSIPY